LRLRKKLRKNQRRERHRKAYGKSRREFHDRRIIRWQG